MLWMIFAAAAALCLGAVLLCVSEKERKGLRVLSGLLAVVLAVGTVAVGLVAAEAVRLPGFRGDTPNEAAKGFFDALAQGDYDDAQSWLEYHDLGLSQAPADEYAALVYAALADSYDYSLQGRVKVTGDTALVTVQLRHLDVTGVNKGLRKAVETALQSIVDRNKKANVFDENDQYLPGIREQACREAIEALTADEANYVEDTLVVTLNRTVLGWRVAADQSLMSALAGLRAE